MTFFAPLVRRAGFAPRAGVQAVRSDRLTDLYRSYGPAIYARCRMLLSDASAAEDATQETFLRVHRHLDRVPSAREGLYWIYRVATNYCLNHLRDQRARPQPRAELPEVGQEIASAEARLGDRDLMWRLIDRAPSKIRVAAWLYHIDGFEQEEIAAILGISRRTVATRLALFLANARKFIRRSAA
ncbi:MAG TPA: sigma-70 family RNA polymerase sigma factor [Polyangia bacterium]|nr:sigma-70 family RNA polymerase sigma factor [Polyangia bacterium]